MRRDLSAMQAKAAANSERWFPELHDRLVWDQIIHQSLGLAGEAGEFVNLIKKLNRVLVPADAILNASLLEDGPQEPATRLALADELADVLTYTLNLASLLGVDLVAAFERKQAICEERWGS